VANAARAQAYATTAWRTLPGDRRLVCVMHERDSARRATARYVLRRGPGVAAVGDTGVDEYTAALAGRTVARVTNFLDPYEVVRVVAARVPPPRSEPPIVGVLARMVEGKGIIELIDELADARGSWSRARIAAPFQDRSYAAHVEDRIRARGVGSDVELLGGVADVGAFLASVDLLVVPSTATEGQPTVVLEALAHGRGVLVRRHVWQSDYAGLPVQTYDGAETLALELRKPAQPPVTARDLIDRFDPVKVLDTLERAATARHEHR